MADKIICAANFEERKYFFDPAFDGLPQAIKEEIRALCAVTAEKLRCAFAAGFHEDGSVYFCTVIPQGMEASFDDIGAELEIKKILKEKQELTQSLTLWYKVKFEGAEI